MSKRSRDKDNSKRQQPIQQQRAQARLPSPGMGGKPGASDEQSRSEPPRQKR